MNLLKSTIQSFKVNMKTIFIFWGVVLGGAVFGFLLETVISHFSGDEILGMGFLFSAIFFGTGAVFGSVFSGFSDFALAVYNGRSRKGYVFGKYVYLVCEYAVSIAILVGVYLLEKSMVSVPEDFIGTFDHPYFICLSIIFVVPVVIMLMSALYAKFDKKFFWGMWAVWMIVMTGGPRIISAMDSNPESTAAKIGNAISNVISIGTIESIIGIIVITIIIAVADVLMYSNIDVKE